MKIRKRRNNLGQIHTTPILEKESTFWEHLEELRFSILRTLAVLLLFFIVAFAVVPHIFDKAVLGAASNDFPIYSIIPFAGNGTNSIEIININIASQFITHISIALWLAFIVSFPYIIWEVWKFTSPALYPHEKKHAGFAFIFGTVMFYTGCAVGYTIVFPFTFNFLAHYNLSAEISNSISLDSYISTFITIILTMGLMFELPLLTWLLGRMGIVTRTMLKKLRRHAIVVLMILAAIITPTGDPFTLLVVFTPLYMLYELGIIIIKNERE